MVAHHGWEVPYVSLDACIPELEPPHGTVPPDKIFPSYAGSSYQPHRSLTTPQQRPQPRPLGLSRASASSSATTGGRHAVGGTRGTAKPRATYGTHQ
eukprot:2043363-Prymnesium_polylepis.2